VEFSADFDIMFSDFPADSIPAQLSTGFQVAGSGNDFNSDYMDGQRTVFFTNNGRQVSNH
jgi:hypothetical protein